MAQPFSRPPLKSQICHLRFPERPPPTTERRSATGLNPTSHLHPPPLISTLLQQVVVRPNTKSQPFSTVSPPHLQSTPLKSQICNLRCPRARPTHHGAPVCDRLKPHPTSAPSPPLISTLLQQGVTHPNTINHPFSTVSPPHLQSTPLKSQICNLRCPRARPTHHGAPVCDRLKPHPTSARRSSVDFSLHKPSAL